jgi:hypothetical protein
MGVAIRGTGISRGSGEGAAAGDCARPAAPKDPEHTIAARQRSGLLIVAGRSAPWIASYFFGL